MFRRVSWISFLVLDAVLVFLYVAGYLALYVRTNTFWWIELIAVFLPYLAVGILGATIVVVVNRRWKLLVVHLVLILLIFVRTNPFERLGYSAAERPDDLTVMTFNVPRWWGYLMPEKTTEMAELIGRIDADIIGLQEAPISFYPDDPPLRAPSYLAVLYDSLGYQTVGPRTSGATYTPQPVLSRFEIVGQDQYKLKLEPDDTTATTVTRTVLKWKGRPFAVYNLHLRTFGEQKIWQEDAPVLLRLKSIVSYLRRYREAYRTRAWEVDLILARLHHEELPIIVCGDLNSTPHNWVMGRFYTVLRDAFGEAGRGWGMTYHTRLPAFRIDYVLVSDHWEIVSADVVDAYLSDHLPVVVRMRLKDEH